MILVTSGLGFIGSHATRALLEAGHDVVATTHSSRRPDRLVQGWPRLAVASLDVLDGHQWDELAARFEIDSVIHLAAVHGEGRVVDTLAADLRGFANVLHFAMSVGARRVFYASSIGVYASVERPYSEDMALPMVAPHAVAATKKSMELAADLARQDSGVELVGLRIGGAWGPLGNPASRFIGLPRLVHAAVARTPLQLDVDVACDLIHVEDVAQAILALVAAPTLNHPVYNVGTGRVTSDREVSKAIQRLIPGAPVSVSNRAVRYEVGPLDVTTLAADTGFRAKVGLQDGLKSYIDRLRREAR